MVNDPLFWKSLWNTFYLTLIGTPLSVVVALGIAMLLNIKGIRGLGTFRTIFFLPVIPGRRRVDPVALAAQSALRAGQSAPCAHRHRRTRLVLRRRVGQERHYPDHHLGCRRRHHHLSGRTAGRAPLALRGRRGRWRRGVGPASPRDDPDDQPGDPLQPGHQGIAAFQSFTQAFVIATASACQRRPGRRRPELAAVLRAQPLQRGVPLLPDGLCVGARLGAARHHPARDLRCCCACRGTASTTRASHEAVATQAPSKRRPRDGAGRGRGRTLRPMVRARRAVGDLSAALYLDDQHVAEDGAPVYRLAAGLDPEPDRVRRRSRRRSRG